MECNIYRFALCCIKDIDIQMLVLVFYLFLTKTIKTILHCNYYFSSLHRFALSVKTNDSK